jgi:hypothetical protein
MNERVSLYRRREDAFQAQVVAFEKRSRNGSLLRLFTFIAGVLVLIYLWSTFPFPVGLIGTLVFIIGFGFLINWHLRLQRQLDHLKGLVRINQREQQLLQFDFQAVADNGKDFLDPTHENAIDLDLFGPYSFFHFANRSGTSIGRSRLAHFLLNPADKQVILDRQEAIRELRDMLDWRQDYQASGQEAADDPAHLQFLQEWMKMPSLVKGDRLLLFLLFFTPLLGLTGFLAWIFYLPWYGALLFFIPQIVVLRRTFEQVNDIHSRTGNAEKLLRHYALLCGQIEQLQPQSPHLQQQHQKFHRGGQTASTAIKKLSYLIAQLNVRYNAFAIFLNLFGLWDLHWIYQLEKWKVRLEGDLQSWFDALAEFEALQSLATLAFNHPDWCFPEITDQQAITTRELGHPLLPGEVGIRNDFSMPAKDHIKLITGSNMAGKSTFLRTVGLNIVLAQSGSPVCAQHMQVPQLRVYSSMRTQDALHESTSSFFAELKRLKFIIEAVESEKPVSHQPFFLLDEILKGTNSRDRHKGSRALIKQLLRANSAGLIATHDLELGDMEAASNGTIENLRMEVEIQDGQLYFDYKLKKGITQSFNATHLMQKMGIDVS